MTVDFKVYKSRHRSTILALTERAVKFAMENIEGANLFNGGSFAEYSVAEEMTTDAVALLREEKFIVED